ncbi:MAG: LysE family translocator [Gammaproteobacteria bacterium]|nr:LysE family translocator [Gammaproteobacteria bacterium]
MFEAFLSLITATTLLLGSPGPAPLALAATGATYGIKKGTPFLLGILLGLSCAIIGATAGLSALFTSFPEVKQVCQFIGAAYICYIAYKIATAPIVVNHAASEAPRFKDGFILNLLNPKAYAAFLAIFSQFLLPFTESMMGYLVTGLTCLAVASIVDLLWLCAGGILKPIFSHPTQARIIRRVFAVLMLGSVIYALR